MGFDRIEQSYTSKDSYRLVWKGEEEDEEHVVFLKKNEVDQIMDILEKNSAGRVELEDEFSHVRIHSDIIQFNLKEREPLEVSTQLLKEKLEEFRSGV